MNQRICYVFPSRSRPERFFDALNNILDMSESDNFFVWAKLDDNDESMNTPEIRDRIEKDYPFVTVKWGFSENKVHAVNRSMEDLPDCDILIIMSDDIRWDVYGFDNEIRDGFNKHFPNLNGTVHFPDDHGGANTIIVSVLGVNLYKILGYLFWPEYESVYPDNDFTEMTKLMGCYAFIKKRLFSHNHPIWGVAPWDEQYRHSERPEVYKKDGETFRKRKANHFGL